ncbi:MAG: hypothetical protein B6D61_12395, partial [Bacteroidetes bacterium 4484_249]
TSRAIPALWCGAWTDVIDTVYQGTSTQYSVLPSLFEYYRKQKEMPSEECFYVLKYIESLWLPSFDVDYGPDYWPEFHSTGSTDEDVANETQWVMDNYHPHFLWVYLADVDHAGHTGIWPEYIEAIHIADSIVGVLWQKIQSDPFYKDSTTLIVTNDHGRHDDEHGGFQHHGCGCEGCRHIEFLALGPNIKKDFVSYQNRYTPDMAVTAAHLLGVEPEKATGNVINEIIEMNTTHENQGIIIHKVEVYPNPFFNKVMVSFTLSEKAFTQIIIYDDKGSVVRTLMNKTQNKGNYLISWDGKEETGKKAVPGIYYINIKAGNTRQSLKVLLNNS